jgi:hypothetical protein
LRIRPVFFRSEPTFESSSRFVGADLVSLETGDREAAGAGLLEDEAEAEAEAEAFLDFTFVAGVSVDLCVDEVAPEEEVVSEEGAAIAGLTILGGTDAGLAA